MDLIGSKNLYAYFDSERDLNLGLSRIAVCVDCKATALTTQPPWLVNCNSKHSSKGILAKIQK